MTDKLLKALQAKYRTPAAALAALGLDAALLPVASRFVLAQDGAVVERATGRKIDKVSFMRHLFEKENTMVQHRLARLARDQGGITSPELPGDPRNAIVEPTVANTAEAPSDDEIVSMLQLFLKGSADPAATLEAITNWVVSQGNVGGAGDGVPANNLSAVKTSNASDRARAAKDNVVRRPAAMDTAARSLNHANFLKRFPDVAKNVEVWGRR